MECNWSTDYEYNYEYMFKKLWLVKVTLSAQVCAQRVVVESLATKDNLKGREIILGNDMCPMYSEKEETISHLFFMCKVALKVWNMYDRWVGIMNVHRNQWTLSTLPPNET